MSFISAPYAQRGALFETYSRQFGKDGDPKILVAQGTGRDFNPSLPQSVIDRAMELDPASASAEYLGIFRLRYDIDLPGEKCPLWVKS